MSKRQRQPEEENVHENVRQFKQEEIEKLKEKLDQLTQRAETHLGDLKKEQQKSADLTNQLSKKDDEWKTKLDSETLSLKQIHEADLQAKFSEWNANATQALAAKDAEWTQKLDDAVRRVKDEARAALSKQAREFSTKIAQCDLQATHRQNETLESVIDAKKQECETLHEKLNLKTKEFDDMKADFDAKSTALDDLKIEFDAQTAELDDKKEKVEEQNTALDNAGADIGELNFQITGLKAEIQVLKHDLDRHSDLTIKQREVRLITKFEGAYKRNHKRRKMPTYVGHIIRDYIVNTCLNDLSSRPLMVSRMAVELGHTELKLEDLLKIGIIASNIHLREKGHRPPKAVHSAGGKMQIDVNIYMQDDRWMLEEAFKEYTGKDNGW